MEFTTRSLLEAGKPFIINIVVVIWLLSPQYCLYDSHPHKHAQKTPHLCKCCQFSFFTRSPWWQLRIERDTPQTLTKEAILFFFLNIKTGILFTLVIVGRSASLPPLTHLKHGVLCGKGPNICQNQSATKGMDLYGFVALISTFYWYIYFIQPQPCVTKWPLISQWLPQEGLPGTWVSFPTAPLQPCFSNRPF